MKQTLHSPPRRTKFHMWNKFEALQTGGIVQHGPRDITVSIVISTLSPKRGSSNYPTFFSEMHAAFSFISGMGNKHMAIVDCSKRIFAYRFPMPECFIATLEQSDLFSNHGENCLLLVNSWGIHHSQIMQNGQTLYSFRNVEDNEWSTLCQLLSHSTDNCFRAMGGYKSSKIHCWERW